MTSTINASTSGGLVSTADTSGVLQLQTGGTAAVTIDASQRVGIGTTSPSYNLDVNGVIAVGSGSNRGFFYSDGSKILLENNSTTYPLAFSVNGAVRATIDSSGNLGLGVTPSAWASGWKVFQAGAYGQGYAAHPSLPISYVTSNAYYNGSNWIYSTSNYANYLAVSAQNGQFQWLTAPSGTAGNPITFTQAMTLDASGNLLVGTTSNTPIGSGVQGVAILNAGRIDINKTSDAGLYIGRQTTTGALVNFYYGGAGPKGSISTDGTNVAYNTSSDYRLKNTIAPMTGALAKVAQLKPVTYKWNVDDSDGEGFIAHELAEVCPHAVTGEKDAVDEDGNPQYQGIDVSFLVATLTAAIQEQQAIINAQQAMLTQLTERISALEGAK